MQYDLEEHTKPITGKLAKVPSPPITVTLLLTLTSYSSSLSSLSSLQPIYFLFQLQHLILSLGDLLAMLSPISLIKPFTLPLSINRVYHADIKNGCHKSSSTTGTKTSSPE